MERINTITSIFMVPTLEIPLGQLPNNGFINAFSKDDSRDIEYKDAIYILFKPKNLDRFRLFLNSEYDRTKSIIDDYDYEDGYVVIVYQLDSKFESDFNLIRQSKYSKTSKEFKELFPAKMTRFTKQGLAKEEFTLQYRIFNRSKDLIEYWETELGVVFDKDQEVWHRFIAEDETLNINKLKENVQRTVV